MPSNPLSPKQNLNAPSQPNGGSATIFMQLWTHASALVVVLMSGLAAMILSLTRSSDHGRHSIATSTSSENPVIGRDTSKYALILRQPILAIRAL